MARRAREWWHGKAIGLQALARIAPHLREPVRFCVRQITRRQGLGRYRLRGSGIAVCIRHSTGDVITLHEVLAERHYEPPAEVDPLLQANGRPLEVADLGANVGLFTAWLLARQPHAHVVAFEPDAGTVSVLREFVRANAREADVEVVQAAAATADGRIRFVEGQFGGSHAVSEDGPLPEDEAGSVTTVDAVDAFPRLERVDLLKIDIEGGEWAILGDPRFRSLPARALTLEYHDYMCPEPDPRAYAHRLLTDAGWTVQHVDVELPPGHGLLWAWKS